MIFKTETYDEWVRRVSEWHRWFAWHPVCWDGGWAWLSTVERSHLRGSIIHEWRYRAPTSKESGE